jgi:hypothetical protein
MPTVNYHMISTALSSFIATIILVPQSNQLFISKSLNVMINKSDVPIYYFKFNDVLTRLTKSTAKWIMSYHTVKHRKGKRMYRSRDASTDKYKYSFCDIVYDSKYRTECIVLSETPCYVTLAIIKDTSQTNPSQVNRSDFSSRRRWKSSELKRTKHVLATIQELHAYVYDLEALFEGLTLETVK